MLFLISFFLGIALCDIGFCGEASLRVPVLSSNETTRKRIEQEIEKKKFSKEGIARLLELKKVVKLLTQDLDRKPVAEEVIKAMGTVTDKMVLIRWLKIHRLTLGNFGIAETGGHASKPLKAAFDFGSKRVHIPAEFSNNIKIIQATKVKVVLESMTGPRERLILLDRGNAITVLYINRDKGIRLQRSVKKSEDNEYIDISETGSYIKFRDVVFGISVDFDKQRKLDLLNWLIKRNHVIYRSQKNRHIVMAGGREFSLPHFYGSHGDRIILLKDAAGNARTVALVDSKKPLNFMVLEIIDDKVYSSESGDVLSPSTTGLEGKIKRRYTLARLKDFKTFHDNLDKTLVNAATLDDLEGISTVAFCKGTFTFWLKNSALNITTMDSIRQTKEQREKYPLILERADDGRKIYIRSYKGGDDQFTVTGLNYKDGSPVILNGEYFNLSVIVELCNKRTGPLRDLIKVDKILIDTFHYRIKPIWQERVVNPIRTYSLDRETQLLRPSYLINPGELCLTNPATGTVPFGSVERMPQILHEYEKSAGSFI